MKYDDDESDEKNEQSIAQQIASHGRRFIEEHLTMKCVEHYWHDLLSKCTQLLNFQPSLNKNYILIVINVCKKHCVILKASFIQIKTIAKIIRRQIDNVFRIYFI